MRKLVVAFVIMVGVYFFLIRKAEVYSIAETLRQADWRFLILAIVLELVWMCNAAVEIWAIYRGMGIDEKIQRLLVLSTAANFVNVVMPSGGVGGSTLLIAEARRRGVSTGRVTVALAVYLFLEYVSFLGVLALALWALFRRSHLTTAEVTASAIMVAIAGSIGTALYFGMRSPAFFGSLLAFWARLINKISWFFLHKNYISETNAHEFAHDAAGGLSRLRHQPRGLILPGLLVLNGKILMLLIFSLMFAAFNVPFSPGVIIAGYAIGYLFSIVSITPAGMGFVEAFLPLTLTQLGISLSVATLITLSYRGVTFWLPIFIGMLVFRWATGGTKVQAQI